jgi:aromatic ring-opening dioxygenase LigB subunit
MIVFAGLLPHPALLIPSLGQGKEENIKKTRAAYDQFIEKLQETEPDTIILISPHMQHYLHLFNICGMSDLYGSFKSLGDNKYEWHGQNDLELAEEISDKAEDEGLPAVLFDSGEGEYELDQGAMVPVYFIEQNMDFSFRLLPIGTSVASRTEHYTFGQVISEVCERRRDKRIAIVASGDLSHRLIDPKGIEDNVGKRFDQQILNAIKEGDEYSIINIDDNLLEEAGQCGYNSLLILLGSISGLDYKPEIYSYEGPFGVGYAVVNMNVKAD